MLPFQTENGSPGDFLNPVMEICHLSVCWGRKKHKLFFAN